MRLRLSADSDSRQNNSASSSARPGSDSGREADPRVKIKRVERRDVASAAA